MFVKKEHFNFQNALPFLLDISLGRPDCLEPLVPVLKQGITSPGPKFQIFSDAKKIILHLARFEPMIFYLAQNFIATPPTQYCDYGWDGFHLN